MKVNRKLRFAAAILAISGLTVACDNDKNNNAAQPAVKTASPSVAAPVAGETAEEKAQREAAEALAARQALITQIKEIAASGVECGSVDALIKEAKSERRIISAQLSTKGMKLGTAALVKTLSKEGVSPECRISAMAKVATALDLSLIHI